jgi:hypothetical protein
MEVQWKRVWGHLNGEQEGLAKKKTGEAWNCETLVTGRISEEEKNQDIDQA